MKTLLLLFFSMCMLVGVIIFIIDESDNDKDDKDYFDNSHETGY